jgi:hypothetical protein
MKADVSQIELVTYRYPAIAADPFLHVAYAGERHVETGYEQLVGRHHIEDSLAGGHGLGVRRHQHVVGELPRQFVRQPCRRPLFRAWHAAQASLQR